MWNYVGDASVRVAFEDQTLSNTSQKHDRENTDTGLEDRVSKDCTH